MTKSSFVGLLTLLAVSSVSTAQADVAGVKQGTSNPAGAGTAVASTVNTPAESMVKAPVRSSAVRQVGVKRHKTGKPSKHTRHQQGKSLTTTGRTVAVIK